MVRACKIHVYSDQGKHLVRVYTICLYSDQEKRYGQSLHNLPLLCSGKAIWSELTQFAFTLIRESGMVRAYTICLYSKQGKQFGQSLHNSHLL